MQLVYGPLIDTKGRKSVLIPSLVISTIGSIGCAFSANIYLFLFFRAVQAIGIAAIPVVSATIIGDLFEGKRTRRSDEPIPNVTCPRTCNGSSHRWLSWQYKWSLICISLFYLHLALSY